MRINNLKKENTLLTLTFLLVLLISCQESEKSNLTLLSDQIPLDTALIFGQGIISTDNYEFAITFNPEMDELFFTRRKPEEDNKIYTMQLVDGSWSAPEVVFFSANKGWDFEPHINPKGDILYFGSIRPLPDSARSTGLHQWYSTKNAKGWSPPVPLNKPFIDEFVMYLTSSENGNLYFTSGKIEASGLEDEGIYNSINETGQYSRINRMGKGINLSGLDAIAHPYIAPDESYIIYDGKSTTGFGNCDLYISFKKNGTWTEAYNLGPEVNTDQCEMCASVSPDGKYLFFHRGVYNEGEGAIGNIYWIDFIRLKEQIEEQYSNNEGK